MTDRGSAMKAGETQAGLSDLSIVWSPTLEYSPYQNAKQEVFWARVEGRLLPMLEGVPDLTLSFLNEVTQAWLELEYNREVHSEIGMSPVAKMLAGPTVARPCPAPDDLRRAFRTRDSRAQRGPTARSRSRGCASRCHRACDISSVSRSAMPGGICLGST